MFKKVFLLIFVINFIFPQIIEHQPEKSIFSNTPLYLEVFCDYNIDDIESFSIFYRSNNNDIYIENELLRLSNYNYGFTVPSEFINNQYIEYYFLLELSNDLFISFPDNDPNNNPLRVRIDNNIITSNFDSVYLEADYNIISPKNNEKISNDELIISLSYFKMDRLDLEKTKIFIDDIDYSLQAEIRNSNIVLVPNKQLSIGKHDIIVNLFSLDGTSFNSILWSFYILSSEDVGKNILFNGKIWNDYNESNIDKFNSYSNLSNINFQFHSNWIDMKVKLKKSSLENKMEQAKDRYSVNIKFSDLFKVHLGDFYPEFSKFFIQGNRVRGIGINFNSKLFQINLINGELVIIRY